MKDINVPYLLVYSILKKSRKLCLKMNSFIFLIVYISTNFALKGLKFWMDETDIGREGAVSQILFLGLGFYFMSKNG